MKKAVFFLFFLLFLLQTQTSFADVHVTTTGDSSVNINQQTSGQTTTCINGNCTTTGGGGHTTATVNGKTYESDGNLDVNDGGAQVHVQSSSGNNSVSVNSSNTSTSVSAKSDSDNSTNNENNDEKDKEAANLKDDKTATPSSKKIQAKIHQNIINMLFAGITGMFHRLFTAFK